MRIKFTTTEHQLAKLLMQPVQEQRIMLGIAANESYNIEWGKIQVHRGALETLFELFGTLQLVTIPAGVMGGILANWLWGHIQQFPKEKREKIKLEIVFDEKDTYKSIRIESENLEVIKNSIEAALKIHQELKGKTDQEKEIE